MHSFYLNSLCLLATYSYSSWNSILWLIISFNPPFWLFGYFVKQAGCIHIWLFYEEKFAGNCKGLPSRRKGLFRSSWYAFVCKLCGVTFLFLSSSCPFCLLLVKTIIYFPKTVFFSAIDAPGGFLFEWWSVFWDIFIARTNEKHSDVAASYIEVNIFCI